MQHIKSHGGNIGKVKIHIIKVLFCQKENVKFLIRIVLHVEADYNLPVKCFQYYPCMYTFYTFS